MFPRYREKKATITSRCIIVLHCNSVNEFDAARLLAIERFHEIKPLVHVRDYAHIRIPYEIA